MNEKKVLKEIHDTLTSGGVYGEMLKSTNPILPKEIFFEVLSFGYCQNSVRPIWRWRHYGSSAKPATVKDLLWILDTVFKMKPSEFVAKYKLLTTHKLKAA